MIFDLGLLLRAAVWASKDTCIVPPGLAPPVGFVSYTVNMFDLIKIFGILTRGTINPDLASGAGLEKFTRIRHTASSHQTLEILTVLPSARRRLTDLPEIPQLSVSTSLITTWVE